MSHDTSRHIIRGDVTCAVCGRQLRGAASDQGRWTVGKHKRPDGGPCIGHMSSSHQSAYYFPPNAKKAPPDAG